MKNANKYFSMCENFNRSIFVYDVLNLCFIYVCIYQARVITRDPLSLHFAQPDSFNLVANNFHKILLIILF